MSASGYSLSILRVDAEPVSFTGLVQVPSKYFLTEAQWCVSVWERHRSKSPCVQGEYNTCSAVTINIY